MIVAFKLQVVTWVKTLNPSNNLYANLVYLHRYKFHELN